VVEIRCSTTGDPGKRFSPQVGSKRVMKIQEQKVGRIREPTRGGTRGCFTSITAAGIASGRGRKKIGVKRKTLTSRGTLQFKGGDRDESDALIASLREKGGGGTERNDWPVMAMVILTGPSFFGGEVGAPQPAFDLRRRGRKSDQFFFRQTTSGGGHFWGGNFLKGAEASGRSGTLGSMRKRSVVRTT